MADFDQLIENCGTEGLGEILDAYLSEVPALLGSLKKAAAEKDTKQARMVAHQLKGLSASLAVNKLVSRAEQLSAALHEENWTQVDVEISQLEKELYETAEAFKAFVAANSP